MEDREFIESAIENYGTKIDGLKADPYSSSTYTVEKPWGKEEWLELTPFFCMKRISMKAGCRSSLQYHNYKTEINYVLEGRVSLLIGPDENHLEERTYGPGESWVVQAGTVHRVIAVTDYVALEASSPHLDDVERISDDNNRPSGLVWSEHIDR